jgi:ectoine hydroxylase-related dioxygenase (phytanoyl-CoA dioxygenase family)
LPGTIENLTSEQHESFDRDGYIVLESPGFADEQLDAIVDALRGKYIYGAAKVGEDGLYYSHGRVLDAWQIDDNIRGVATNPTILAILQELYGRKPLPFQTINFEFGTEQSVHSDTISFNSDPPGFMCGVWVALEDVDMNNGPLIYYPGTHKLPEVKMQDVGAPARHESRPEYERFMTEKLEREGHEPRHGTMRKGQALIWSSNILHGGAPRRDPARTRNSQVTHYFFEGCKYYTPLLSDETKTEWRNPNWIT